MTADALTTVLDKTKLEQARARLGLTQFCIAGTAPGLGGGLRASLSSGTEGSKDVEQGKDVQKGKDFVQYFVQGGV